MFHFFFLFIMFLMNFLFLIMNHPLSMGLILMMQTILITIFSGLLTKTFWFSYSLFLIFLGGMLILFMYMTSIAANETFNMNFFLSFNIPLIFLFLSFILMFDWKMILFNLLKNMETMNLFNLKNILTENTFTLNKFFNFPLNLLTIFLVNYLFLTLIAIVKITNIFNGPMRQKF